MAKAYKVQVRASADDSVLRELAVQGGKNGNGAQGRAVKVATQSGMQYELFDEELGRGPDKLLTKRVGDDLVVAFDGGSTAAPDLVLENYYQNCTGEEPCEVIGQGRDNLIGAYVPENGGVESILTNLAQNSQASQVLMNAPVGATAGAALAGLALGPILGALGLAGVAAAALAQGDKDPAVPADTTAPNAPAVNSPSNGRVISGTAEPGSKVEALDKDGKVIGTTTTGPDGKWSITPSTKPADGTVSVTATDAAGNKSDPGVGVVDSSPTTIAAPSATGYDAANPVSGTGPKGSIVVVTLPDGSVKSVPVDADGKWALKPADMPATPMTSGEITATAKAPGTEETLSQVSGKLVQSPYTASITALIPPNPMDGSLDTKNAVLVTKDANGNTLYGGKTSLAEGNYFLSGKTNAPEGSIVTTTVLISSGGKTTEQVVTGKADANGNWTQIKSGEEDFGVLLAADPTAGSGSTTTMAINLLGIKDPAGASAALAFVPITAQAVAEGVRVAAGDVMLASAEVAPLTKVLANGTVSVSSTDSTPITQNVGSVETVAISDDSGVSAEDLITNVRTQTITGIAYAQYKVVDGQYVPADPGTPAPIGSTVFVSVGGGEVRSARVGLKGVWTLNYTDVVLADGKYDVKVHTFNFEQQRIEAPVKTIVIDTQAAVTLNGDIAGDGVINASEKAEGVKLGGSVQGVEAGQKVTVKVTDGTTVVTKEAVVGADGKWSLVLNDADLAKLKEGTLTVTATATDIAGNTAPASSATVKYDVSAPTAPAQAPVATDDQGPVQGPINDGDITDDAKPTFSGGAGSAEPGATVVVYDNGQPVGSTTVNPDGSWSFTPELPLGEGEHSITTSVKDPAGNESAQSPALTFTVDSVAPTVPAITSVVDDVAENTGNIQPNSVTNDKQPTINGTGTPANVITIYDTVGGQQVVLGSTTVDKDGKWTFTVPADKALADGAHAITAQASNAAGAKSPETGVFGFTVDTVAPSQATGVTLNDDVGAVQGAIPANGTTDDNTPTLSGQAEPGATVVVYDNGKPIGSTTAKPDGSWSFTPSTPLADGAHAISYQVVDAAGNSSPVSTPVPFAVDTSKVSEPTIVAVRDDFGNANGAVETVAKDGATNDNTPTITGMAPAGTTVTVYDTVDGVKVKLGETTADANGNWSFTVPADKPLADGKHSFSAVATNAAGVDSPESGVYGINLDTVAPVKPAAPIGTDNVGAIQGQIAQNGVTDDQTPVFSGKGTAGNVVTVTDDKGGVLGSVTVAADGTWNFKPATRLPEGPHSVTVTETDPAGNVSAPSAPLVFTVDVTAPTAPAKAPVATDDQGPVQGPINDGDITDDAKPTFSGGAGSAEPGATVVVYDNGQPVGSTTVNPDGSWSFTPELPLGEGEHSITTSVKDPAGNESAQSPALTFTVDSVAPTVPAITSVVDDVAENTGNIQPNSVTNDKQPTINGTGTPANVITIYDTVGGQQVVLGSTTVDKDGKWTFTVPADKALADGAHAITAQASNAAGAKSPETGVFGFTVDTVAPSQATGVTLNDDVGAVQGAIPANGTTDDNTPTLSGQAEPGATVVVYDNGKPIGSTTAKPDGSWSFTPSTPLADGAHAISYQVVDAAGNSSPVSTAVPFKVDTSKVSEPSIVAVRDNFGNANGAVVTIPKDGATNDNTPTITGTAPAGSKVTVYDTVNGTKVKLGETTADANGNWSFTVPADKPLADGKHSFSATATNAAGTVSPESGVYGINLDTVAPVKPAAPIGTDNVGAIQGQIAQNGVTDDQTPVFSGKGTAGNVVTVTDDKGGVLGSVTVAADGTWNFKPATRLPEGPHSVTVTETDPAGNVSAPSAPLVFTVDVTAPNKPASAPDMTPESDTGISSTDDLTKDTTPSFAIPKPGSGETPKLYVDGKPVDAVYDPVAGTLTPTKPLSDGQHDISYALVDAAGNESAQSAPLKVVIDTTAPNGPKSATITTDANNDGFLSGPELAGGNTVKVDVALPAGAVAGDRVVLSNAAGAQIGTRVIDASDLQNGKVTFTVNAPAEGATLTVNATIVDAAGNVSGSVSDSAQRQTTSGPAPTAVTITTDANNDGFINTAELNGGSTVSVDVSLPAGVAVNDVVRVTDGTTERRVTLTDAMIKAGKVTVSFNAPAEGGTISVAATIINAVGNESAAARDSAKRDTTAPNVPGTAPDMTAATDTGRSNTDNITGNNKPSFAVQAPAAGDTVVLFVDGKEVQATWNAAAGTLTPVNPIADGTHVIEYAFRDAAGNTSPRSPSLSNVVIDTVASGAPFARLDPSSDTGTVGDGATTDTTPTISGTGSAGDVIIVRSPTGELQSAVVSDNGTWSVTFGTPVAFGSQIFSATATDAAGNVSAATSLTLKIEGASIGGAISGGGTSVQSWQSVQVAYTDLSWSKFKTVDKLGWSGVHKLGVYTMVNGREVYTELASTDGWIWNWNHGGSARVKGSFVQWAIDGCKVGGDAWVNKLFHSWGYTEILCTSHSNTFQWESQWVTTGTAYDVSFSNLALAASGCYKLTFTGGSNFKVKTAGGAEIARNADGTYTIDLNMARNGVKVEVANGGSKPSSVTSKWVSSGTPLVLDLDGDGVQTVGADAGVAFDLLATGTLQKTGWVGKGDGLLAIDLNGDGKINDGSELFGEATLLADGTRAADGFAALAQYDANGDGRIDANDAIFKELKVWTDANLDGLTDADELKSLAELGIQSLNLWSIEQDVYQNGNKIGLVSNYTTDDGKTHQLADVWFETQGMAMAGPFNPATINDGKLSLVGEQTAVKLTLADVLAEGQGQLTVTGDAGDMVQLGNGDGWQLKGATEVGGVTYAVYDNSTAQNAELLIQQNLNVTIV